MREFSMWITLRSDMCCGTGEADGAGVDVVTALDAFGLPYIPAKRLKGLLRDEMAIVAPDHVDALFGSMSCNIPGKLIFGDARIEGYEELTAWIEQEEQRDASVRLRAKLAYTTTRTSVAIDPDGVARDHSLRTIELVRAQNSAGEQTRFQCSIMGMGVNEEEENALKRTASCLRAVGMGKTRGLGEVECSGSWSECSQSKSPHVLLHIGDTTRSMRYRVILNSPCAINTVSERGCDYIPGSVVQGAFASVLGRDDPGFLVSRVLRGTCFSNAYVEVPKRSGVGAGMAPTLPVPLTLMTEKNARGTKVGDAVRLPLHNAAMASDESPINSAEFVQRVPVPGFGANLGKNYVVCEPTRSISFHSSRGDTEQGKQLYSLTALDAGQSFGGTVWAAADVLKRLAKVVESRDGRFSLGSTVTGGFGKCELFLEEDLPERSLELREGDRIAVCLDSDVVVVDEHGSNVTTSDALAKLFSKDLLGIDCEVPLGDGEPSHETYVRTCVVGGYNAHWRLPKRQYVAFQKGSVIVLRVRRATTLASRGWIGYLQEEGYGQYHIEKLDPRRVKDSFLAISRASYGAGSVVHDCGEVVTRLKREGVFYRLLDSLNELSFELAQDFPLSKSSKSGAMRISAIARTSLYKEWADEHDSSKRLLANEAFRQLAHSNFGAGGDADYSGTVKEKDAVLLEACDDVANGFDELLFGSEDEELPKNQRLTDGQRRQLFSHFVNSYVHQLRQRYLLEGGE